MNKRSTKEAASISFPIFHIEGNSGHINSTEIFITFRENFGKPIEVCASVKADKAPILNYLSSNNYLSLLLWRTHCSLLRPAGQGVLSIIEKHIRMVCAISLDE